MHWLGEVDDALQQRCVRHILKRQLPDGGWNIYYGGPSEVNASVKAYFALKLAGHSADLPFMQEARANILRLGGIPRMNTFSKLYLALLGQFPWQYLPSIPVEMILLPNWAAFNIYKMSSWSRAMLVPLAIINHFKPTRELPGMKQLHELYPLGTEHKDFTLPRDPRFFAWRNFFLRADHAHQDDLQARAGGRCAAARWKKRNAGCWSGSGRGATDSPPCSRRCSIALIALRALGYSPSTRSTKRPPRILPGCLWMIRKISAFSPACRRSGTRRSTSSPWRNPVCPPSIRRCKKAANWLVEKEVRMRGDWAVNNPHPEASGWAFEYNNVYYPDTDDTAMVLMALRLVRPEDQPALGALFRRALGLAIEFPMPRRRLGGVRQGSHPTLAGGHAVRGP